MKINYLVGTSGIFTLWLFTELLHELRFSSLELSYATFDDLGRDAVVVFATLLMSSSCGYVLYLAMRIVEHIVSMVAHYFNHEPRIVVQHRP